MSARQAARSAYRSEFLDAIDWALEPENQKLGPQNGEVSMQADVSVSTSTSCFRISLSSEGSVRVLADSTEVNESVWTRSMVLVDIAAGLSGAAAAEVEVPLPSDAILQWATIRPSISAKPLVLCNILNVRTWNLAS
ncbi:MAG: hypothetical protein HC767_12485 [Akkermansiaceae bacterium]|nr:hypothetical protein [Akkermansiaceae bacterium]